MNNENTPGNTGTFIKTMSGTNPMTSPPAKRRRSESSTNQQLSVQSSELTTLTLDQLKVQYGNVSVSCLVYLMKRESSRFELVSRKRH